MCYRPGSGRDPDWYRNRYTPFGRALTTPRRAHALSRLNQSWTALRYYSALACPKQPLLRQFMFAQAAPGPCWVTVKEIQSYG